MIITTTQAGLASLLDALASTPLPVDRARVERRVRQVVAQEWTGSATVEDMLVDFGMPMVWVRQLRTRRHGY